MQSSPDATTLPENINAIHVHRDRGARAREFAGLEHEAVFYDPEAFVQPVRDLYNRPWARIWEEYFEKGMKRPVEADDLGGFR